MAIIPASVARAAYSPGVVVHNLSGTTPTLTVSPIAAIDINQQTLSANITSITTPANSGMDDGDIILLKLQQAASGGPYTIPTSGVAGSPLTAGSGVTIQSSRLACPTVPSAASGAVWYQLHWNANTNVLMINDCGTGTPICTSGSAGTICAAGGSAPTGVSNVGEFWYDQAYQAWLINSNNGTNEIVAATSSGYAPYTICATGTFGSSSSFPTGQQIAAGVANTTCHFTYLSAINMTGGTCTTAPTFNVFDGASNTGTAVLSSATQQTTRGTVTKQLQALSITAMDTYGFYVSTAGGTCTAPIFAVCGSVACP